MIYRCSNPNCQFLGEGEHLETCPECGSPLLVIQEGELSGKDWAALGVYAMSPEHRNDARCFECCRNAAKEGELWGICNLGWCYEEGIGVEADPEEAFWLYSQAAEMGYVPAICNS